MLPRRSSELHLVMATIERLKMTGVLSKPNSPKPKPGKKAKGHKKTKITERKALEMEAEKLSRELVNWRDVNCVLKGIDGQRCSSVLQWGHFVPCQQSPYLKYAIGNTFKQCSAHNLLHDKGDQIFIDWYNMTFGNTAYHAMQEVVRAHRYQKPELWELQEWIDRYRYLLDDRPSMFTFDLLREAGYYGWWTQDNG